MIPIKCCSFLMILILCSYNAESLFKIMYSYVEVGRQYIHVRISPCMYVHPTLTHSIIRMQQYERKTSRQREAQRYCSSPLSCSAVSLLSLHQFLCKILRNSLTICATVAALSLHSRPKQAALASSLPLITLFSCVYCFFAQRRRHRSLLLTCPVQLTGALLFLHLHSLTLPPASPHPTPHMHHFATHRRCWLCCSLLCSNAPPMRIGLRRQRQRA